MRHALRRPVFKNCEMFQNNSINFNENQSWNARVSFESFYFKILTRIES